MRNEVKEERGLSRETARQAISLELRVEGRLADLCLVQRAATRKLTGLWPLSSGERKESWVAMAAGPQSFVWQLRGRVQGVSPVA